MKQVKLDHNYLVISLVYAYNVHFRLFFIANNTFSNIIDITTVNKTSPDILNTPTELICFIPYISAIYPYKATPYGTFIDLNGNIVNNAIRLEFNITIVNAKFIAAKGLSEFGKTMKSKC